MKILLINDHAHFGGGGDAVLKLEHEILSGRGHEVFTYAWGKGGDNQEEKLILAPEPVGRKRQRLVKFFGSRSMRLHFRRTLQKIQPDVVHVHLVSKYPLVVYPELGDYPVLQTMHGPTFFCPTGWGNYRVNCQQCHDHASMKCFSAGCCSRLQATAGAMLYRRVCRYFRKNVDLFHAPSVHLTESMKEWGFPNAKYIPLGIDRCFAEQRPAVWPRAKNILFVGALVEAKGVDVLVDAFAEVVKHDPEVRLQIAGRGILEPVLRDKIRLYHLEKQVEMLGFVDRQTVLQLYRQAYMVVMPSVWWEQFGMVIPESFASATPVVGTAVGGIQEQLMTSPYGLVVPPRDPHALADKILYFLQNPDAAEKMGMEARDFALKKYDPDRYIDALEKEFAELISQKEHC